MIFSLAFIFSLFSRFHCIIQSGTTYYGTASELQYIPRGQEPVMYFLKPDRFKGLDCTDQFCLLTLINGSRFVCEQDVVSELHQHIFIPKGVTLLPSCQETQLITRVSKPTEDMGRATVLSSALSSLDAGYMPCTICVIEGENISIQHVHFDKSQCLHFQNNSFNHLPLYLSSALVVLPTNLKVANMFFQDVKLINEAVLLYIGTHTAPAYMENISVLTANGSKVFIDRMSGQLISDSSVNLISFCPDCNITQESLQVEKLLGPSVIKMLYMKGNVMRSNEGYFFKILFIMSSAVLIILSSYMCTKAIHTSPHECTE